MLKKILLLCLFIFAPALQASTVASGEAQLFCRTMGRGKPLIVIHGGPGLSHEYLLPQMERLAAHNFVIFYDQRACGKSTGEINSETVNIASYVQDLEAIRTAFHFDKITLLGHSWGGFLALQYAVAHPEQVEALILANPMPASSGDLLLFANEVGKRLAPYQSELEAMHRQDGDPDVMERYYRLIFRTYCCHPEKADLINLRETATAWVEGGKVNALFWEKVFAKPFDLHPALKNLHLPTLVIHGEADPVPAITAQKTHESISGSICILLKECGHFPYVEQPDVFFNSVKAFLKAI